MAIMTLWSRLTVSRDEYDAVRQAVNWEGDVPQGAVAHFIGFRDDHSAGEVDVWESRADYERYREIRLNPVLARLGVTIEEPEILDVHMGALGGPSAEAYVVPRALTPA